MTTPDRYLFDAHPFGFDESMRTGCWRGVCTYVHDGDTLSVQLDRGFGDASARDVRINGLFEPELSDAEGLAKRDALVGLAFGRPVLVHVVRTRADREAFSFSRVVADVYVTSATRRLVGVRDHMESLGMAPLTRGRLP